MAAIRAFIINGAPYAYPPVRGEATIGFPTAHAVAPLKGKVQATDDLTPVWQLRRSSSMLSLDTFREMQRARLGFRN
jgi:hypothetical protein